MDKGIVYGLFAAAGLAVYFLLMRMLGLHDEYWLRVFNIVIVGTGLYMLLNNHIRRDHSRIGYLGSLGLGIRIPSRPWESSSSSSPSMST